MNFKDLIKRPSAFVPILMSILAIIILLIHIMIAGVEEKQGEEIVTDVFEILIIWQLPVIIFFALKWMSQSFKNALIVLFLQIAVAAGAFCLIYHFHL